MLQAMNSRPTANSRRGADAGSVPLIPRVDPKSKNIPSALSDVPASKIASAGFSAAATATSATGTIISTVALTITVISVVVTVSLSSVALYQSNTPLDLTSIYNFVATALFASVVNAPNGALLQRGGNSTFPEIVASQNTILTENGTFVTTTGYFQELYLDGMPITNMNGTVGAGGTVVGPSTAQVDSVVRWKTANAIQVTDSTLHISDTGDLTGIKNASATDGFYVGGVPRGDVFSGVTASPSNPGKLLTIGTDGKTVSLSGIQSSGSVLLVSGVNASGPVFTPEVRAGQLYINGQLVNLSAYAVVTQSGSQYSVPVFGSGQNQLTDSGLKFTPADRRLSNVSIVETETVTLNGLNLFDQLVSPPNGTGSAGFVPVLIQDPSTGRWRVEPTLTAVAANGTILNQPVISTPTGTLNVTEVRTETLYVGGQPVDLSAVANVSGTVGLTGVPTFSGSRTLVDSGVRINSNREITNVSSLQTNDVLLGSTPVRNVFTSAPNGTISTGRVAVLIQDQSGFWHAQLSDLIIGPGGSILVSGGINGTDSLVTPEVRTNALYLNGNLVDLSTFLNVSTTRTITNITLLETETVTLNGLDLLDQVVAPPNGTRSEGYVPVLIQDPTTGRWKVEPTLTAVAANGSILTQTVIVTPSTTLNVTEVRTDVFYLNGTAIDFSVFLNTIQGVQSDVVPVFGNSGQLTDRGLRFNSSRALTNLTLLDTNKVYLNGIDLETRFVQSPNGSAIGGSLSILRYDLATGSWVSEVAPVSVTSNGTLSVSAIQAASNVTAQRVTTNTLVVSGIELDPSALISKQGSVVPTAVPVFSTGTVLADSGVRINSSRAVTNVSILESETVRITEGDIRTVFARAPNGTVLSGTLGVVIQDQSGYWHVESSSLSADQTGNLAVSSLQSTGNLTVGGIPRGDLFAPTPGGYDPGVVPVLGSDTERRLRASTVHISPNGTMTGVSVLYTTDLFVAGTNILNLLLNATGPNSTVFGNVFGPSGFVQEDGIAVYSDAAGRTIKGVPVVIRPNGTMEGVLGLFGQSISASLKLQTPLVDLGSGVSAFSSPKLRLWSDGSVHYGLGAQADSLSYESPGQHIFLGGPSYVELARFNATGLLIQGSVQAQSAVLSGLAGLVTSRVQTPLIDSTVNISVNPAVAVVFNNKNLEDVNEANFVTVRTGVITTASGDLLVSPVGSNVNFNSKNLLNIASAALSTITTPSGDLLINPQGSNVNFNSKNLLNVASAAVSILTTSSGDLLISPAGSNVNFGSKNLINITSVATSVLTTQTGDLSVNPQGSNVDFNTKTLLNVLSAAISTITTPSGDLLINPQGSNVNLNSKNLINVASTSTSVLTTPSGDLLISPVGNNVNFGSKNLINVTSVTTSVVTTQSGADLSINPQGTNVDFNSKTLLNIASAAMSTITTPSGDLLVNPQGSNVDLNSKNLINVASAAIALLTTTSGDLSINPVGSNVNFNTKNLVNISSVATFTLTTPSGSLSINPQGSNVNFNSKTLASIGILNMGQVIDTIGFPKLRLYDDGTLRYGFGVQGGILGYEVPGTNAVHVFRVNTGERLRITNTEVRVNGIPITSAGDLSLNPVGININMNSKVVTSVGALSVPYFCNSGTTYSFTTAISQTMACTLTTAGSATIPAGVMNRAGAVFRFSSAYIISLSGTSSGSIFAVIGGQGITLAAWTSSDAYTTANLISTTHCVVQSDSSLRCFAEWRVAGFLPRSSSLEITAAITWSSSQAITWRFDTSGTANAGSSVRAMYFMAERL